MDGQEQNAQVQVQGSGNQQPSIVQATETPVSLPTYFQQVEQLTKAAIPKGKMGCYYFCFIVYYCCMCYRVCSLAALFHPAQPVTGESQQQAETPEDVELAAKNAHIDMLQSQLEDAAKQIASLYNRPPDTIIKTVPVEVVKTIEVEREKRAADFSIVTDPKQPDKQVDLKQIEKLPTDTPVTLNQYNVFAYKQKLRQIELTPDWSETIQGKWKLDEVAYGESRKISNDGKYVGWKAGYSFKHEEVKAAVTCTF